MANTGAGSNLYPSFRGGGAAASTLGTGLIHYWALGEASGDRADTSPGTTTLTPSGAIGSATGKNGDGALFNVDDARALRSAIGFSLGNVNWTISLWFYNTSGYLAPVFENTNVTTTNEFYIYHTAAHKIEVGIADWGAYFTPTFSVPHDTAWKHVVIWHDADNDILGASVNGATAQTVATGGQYAVSGGNRIYAGGEALAGTGITGVLDEVAIWNKVLSLDERTELYNSGAGKFYPF